MAKKHYYLKNIRTLLTEGFNKEELLHLCFDADKFRPLYHELAETNSKTEVVDKLLEYAHRKILLDTLLKLCRESNLAQYEKHQPYVGSNRILLLDDVQDWREQLGGLLKERGYEVTTVATREEAILYMQTDEPYALAILDMRLDEADEKNREGVTLGQWFRNRGHTLPIIIMSAYTMDPATVKNMTLRPFQFVAVEKGRIGSGGFDDLLKQIELALS